MLTNGMSRVLYDSSWVMASARLNQRRHDYGMTASYALLPPSSSQYKLPFIFALIHGYILIDVANTGEEKQFGIEEATLYSWGILEG